MGTSWLGPVKQTKPRNKGRVDAIGLRANHLALGKRFDPRGVDEAHDVPGIGQGNRDVLAPSSSGFQADMCTLDLAVFQPRLQLRNPSFRVRSASGCDALLLQQRGMQVAFSDVDPQNVHGVSTPTNPLASTILIDTGFT